MVNQQYITKEIMRRIHWCVAVRKAKGVEVTVRQLVNELVAKGLEEYMREHEIEMPVRERPTNEEIMEKARIVHGRIRQ